MANVATSILSFIVVLFFDKYAKHKNKIKNIRHAYGNMNWNSLRLVEKYIVIIVYRVTPRFNMAV